MNWIVVKRFPLDTDLSHVTGFLRERNIAHHIYEEAGEQVVVVADEKIVEPLAHFLDGVAQGKLKIEQSVNPSPVPTGIQVPSLLDQIKSAPVTLVLILLSAIGALVIAVDENFLVARWLTFQNYYSNGTAVPFNESLSQGQIWRFITPAFLHFGFLHFLFNSLWMWDLGRRLEFLLGKRGYILFFIFTSVVSNFAQYIWANDSLFGGMSGVVYALVGFIMVSHRLAPNKLTAVSPGIIVFMLIWLVLCMTGTVGFFTGSGIANAAHLGGLLAGCLFALLTVKRFKESSEI